MINARSCLLIYIQIDSTLLISYIFIMSIFAIVGFLLVLPLTVLGIFDIQDFGAVKNSDNLGFQIKNSEAIIKAVLAANAS